MEIYALYDDNDYILGCYSRDELKVLLNTTQESFNSIIYRLKKGIHNHVKYKGKQYKVYIFKELL